MCMLFIFVNPNPGDGDYLLVLASTRDEFYIRPSRVCHFWEKNPSILGGMDFEEGKQGGTWLAMNTSGQVAALLNLMQPLHQMCGDKKDRGFLVVKFLEGQTDGPTYLQRLQREGHLYHGFLMVTMDVRPNSRDAFAACYTNSDVQEPTSLRPGIHVFGNCSPSNPWKKVDAAKRKFSKIITRSQKAESKEFLIENLFRLLRDDTPHFPDEQLQKDAEGRPEESLKPLSAVFVKIPEAVYGSRTHTVILIDTLGQVDYAEKTMQEPIDLNSDVQWITTRLQFSIPNPDQLISRL